MGATVALSHAAPGAGAGMVADCPHRTHPKKERPEGRSSLDAPIDRYFFGTVIAKNSGESPR